ncbi:MAG: hypothetical protein WC865_08200 [Bacteroidales bacterium]
MRFSGLHTAGTAVPLGELCLKSLWKTSLLIFCTLTLSTPSALIPGKHNTTPITGCTGYNPAKLTFTTATSGGLPPYAYQWQLNDIAIPGDTLSSFDPPQITVAGSYSYNCAITDASGTVVTTSPKVITVVADPTVTITGAGIVCLNTTITLTSIVTDGIGTISYQWQSSVENVTFNSIPGATASTYSPVTSIAGTLYYRVNIYPAVGSCNNAASAPVAVTVNALPTTSLIYHL